MAFALVLAALFFAPYAVALDARNSPADYPMQTAAKDMKVGVEYMVHSFLAENQSFSIDDYLLVETGIYPQREANVDLRRFTLRINGKTILLTQTPGMVAASVKYPDWRMRPSLEGSATRPDGGGVIVGRPPTVGRWPGDPRQSPTPQEPSGNIDSGKQPVDYGHLIERAALPEGKFNKPVAGFLYFPYTGKLKSIRTVELLIDDQVLKLR